MKGNAKDVVKGARQTCAEDQSRHKLAAKEGTKCRAALATPITHPHTTPTHNTHTTHTHTCIVVHAHFILLVVVAGVGVCILVVWAPHKCTAQHAGVGALQRGTGSGFSIQK